MAEKLYLPINLKVDGRKKAQKKPLPLRPPVFPPVEPLDLEERLRRLREQEYIQETERLPFAPRTLPVRSLAERLLAQREGQVLRPPVTFRGKTPGEMLFPQELRIPSLGGRGLPGIEPTREQIPQMLPPEVFGPPSETRAVPRMALGVAKGLVSPFIPPQWGIGKRIGIEPIEWETQPTPMGALAAIPGGALIGAEMAAITRGAKPFVAGARRAMVEEAGFAKLPKKPQIQVGDIIGDKRGLIQGKVLGIGTMGPKRNPWPAYRIEILTGHQKGQISAIIKEHAKLLKKAIPEVAKPPPVVPKPAPAPMAEAAEKGKLFRKDLGEMYDARKIIADELRANNYRLNQNLDGTITIYHGTSSEAANAIRQSGRFNENSFFSHAQSRAAFGSEGAKQYGKEVLAVKVDARDITFYSSTGELEAVKGLVRGKDGIWRAPDRVLPWVPSEVPVPVAEVAKPVVAPKPVSLPSPADIEVELENIRSIIADTTLTSQVRKTAQQVLVYAEGADTRSLARYGRALDEAIISQSLQQNEVSANALRRLKVSIDRIIGNIPSGKPMAEAAVRPPSAVPEGVPMRPAPRGEMPSAPPPGPKAEIPSVQPPMPAPVAAKPVGGAPPGGLPPVKPPTATGGLPPKKPPLNPQDVVKEWQSQIREAKKLRGPTAEAISKERAKRKAIIEKALVGKRGEEARRAAFGVAKGEILTPEFEPASQVFTPEKAELLQEMIRDRFQKDGYRWMPAQTAFDKLFTGGRIPAPSEMAALEEVFGSEFIKAVLDKRGGGIKAWELFIELWNVPKAMKAAYDISDTLRQGAFLLLEGNPAKEAFKARMRSLVSEKAFEAVNESIAANKWYDLSQSLGRDSLDLTLPRVARGLVGKEEPYIGARLAEKIPIIGKGVRMSERAYTAGLNKIRMDTFAQQAEILQKQGADIEAFKKLAWNINVMSGRGSLGKFTQAAMLLNLPFFSPRFATSRFQMPLIFATKNPVLLKMALKDVVGYISSVFAMEALLDLAGVAEVEWDTRSSDFAKVRIGNTRFDPFAGFQQPVVFVAQLIAGKRKTLATGAMVPVDPRERVGQFAETKLATTPGALLALKRGKAYGGEKLTPANFLTSLLVPMTMEDVWEAAQEGKGLADSILWGLGAGVPAALGVGVQTFGIADWQKDFKDYIAIPTSATEREAKGIRLSREKYRERNPEIDAKLFILGEVTSLQTEDSVTAALRLIQENKIDPEDIKGIKAKMDDAKERQKLGLAPKPDDTLVGYLMNELKAQKLREVLGITPKPTPGKSLRDLLPITPTPQNLRELLPAGVR